MDRRLESDIPRSGYSPPSHPHSIGGSFRSKSPSLSPSPPFNPQNRRLQLRNARFRGALLASASASTSSQRQVSPPQLHIETWRSSLRGIEDEHEDEDKENEFDYSGGTGYEGFRTTANTSASNARRSSILRELGNSTQRRKGQSPRVPVTSIFQTQPDSPPWSATFGRPKACIEDPEPGPETELEPGPILEEKMRPSRKLSVSSHKSSTFTTQDRVKRPKGLNRDGRRDTSQYIEHLENQLAATLHDAEVADSHANAARYKALNSEYRILKQEVAEWEEKFEARVEEEEAAMAEREAHLKAKVRSLERDVEAKENKIRELEWEVEKSSQSLRTLEAVNATNRSLERRVDVLTELLAQSPSRVEPPPFSTTIMPDGSSMSNGESVCRTPRPKSMFTKIPLSPIRQPLFQPTNEPDVALADPCKRSGGEEDSRAFELASVDSGFDSCSGPAYSQRTSLLSSQSLGGTSPMAGAESGTASVTSFPLSPEIQLQGKMRQRNRKMRRFPSGCCTLRPLVLPTASAALTPYAPPVSSSSPNSIQQQRLARYFSTLRYSRAETGYEELYDDDEMDVDDADADVARIDALHSLEGNTVHYQSFEEAMAGHDLSIDEIDDPSDSYLIPKSPAQASDLLSYGGGTVRRRNNRSRRISALYVETSPVKRVISARPNPPSWLEKLHIYIPQFLTSTRTLTLRIFSNSWHSNWRRLGSLSWWFLGLLLGTQTRNQWFRRATMRDNARCRAFSGESEMEELSTPISVNHQPINTAQGSTEYPPAMQEWLKFSVTLVLAIGLAVRDGPRTLMCPCPLPEEHTDSGTDDGTTTEPEEYSPLAKYESIRTSLSILDPSLLPRDAFNDIPD